MSRWLLALVLVVAASARAQWLDSSGHLLVTGGGAYHAYSQQLGAATKPQTVTGLSPTNVHLSGAWWFNGLLGVELEGRLSTFFALQRDAAGTVSSSVTPIPLTGFDATVALAARWKPASLFALELQLGPTLWQRSAISLDQTTGSAQLLGGTGSLVATLSPSRDFGLQLYGRVTPFSASLGNTSVASPFAVMFGAQAQLLALHAGPLQLGLAATAEGAHTAGTVKLASSSGSVTQWEARFGLGVSLLQYIEDPRTTGGGVDLPGRLEGTVKLADGKPAGGAKVLLDGAGELSANADGRFSFDAVAAGAHSLTASLEGFTSTTMETKAPASDVVVTLGAPTGPGTVVGSVTDGERPLVNVQVKVVENNVTVASAADGSFTLAKVGPGPVTVKATLPEYLDVEEVVQVQPGGRATLELKMLPRAAGSKAVLRGLVRAKVGGEPLKSTVRVVELKMTLQVGADGRFSANVPSGKYTLIIESRGYVTQTKKVEVSGGDQAIFHTELEKAR